MCKSGFRASGDTAEWSTYTYLPFSPPPKFDIDAMLATIDARVADVADHLALLQTDAAYLRKYIRTSSQDAISKGGRWPDSMKMAESDILLDVLSLNWWLGIREEAQHVKEARQGVEHLLRRGAPLPSAYDETLTGLELVLVNMMNINGHVYMNQIQQRPGFSDYFIFTKVNHRTMQVQKRSKQSFKLHWREDPLFWCLLNLCGKPDDHQGIAHDRLFRFLDEHLSSAPMTDRRRLDQTVVDQMSNHTASHQLLLNLRLHRPQNARGDREDFLDAKKRRAGQEDMSLWSAVIVSVLYCFGAYPRSKSLEERRVRLGESRSDCWIKRCGSTGRR